MTTREAALEKALRDIVNAPGVWGGERCSAMIRIAQAALATPPSPVEQAMADVVSAAKAGKCLNDFDGEMSRRLAALARAQDGGEGR